jgi:hypothetical protein
MENNVLQLQIELLEQQIDLEEANYKEAIFLKKDYFVLRKLRETIRDLKLQLALLREKNAKLSP